MAQTGNTKSQKNIVVLGGSCGGVSTAHYLLKHAVPFSHDEASYQIVISIAIAGGGPAGIETAGELGEFLNGRACWFSSKLANPKVPDTVVNAGPKIRGISVIKNARVKIVAPHGAGTQDFTTKATLILEDGNTLDADLYIPATGSKPNTNIIQDALLTVDGRVDTNRSTLRFDKAGPRVYAVGNVASYSEPAIHLILNAIPVLCTNIKRDLLLTAEGKSPVNEDRIFEDTREAQMAPIGKSKGVGAAMGFQLPSFMVWLIKGRDYYLMEWKTVG